MLDRATVEDVFTEMGEILARQRLVGKIIVFGSVAMLLQDHVSIATHDVDVKIESNHGAIERAAHQVADRRGWLRSWLNEAVIQYLGTKQDIHMFRNYPDDPGLQVYVATPENLLALKISASRQHDFPHAVILARATGITTVHGLSRLVRSYFPNYFDNTPRDIRRIKFILEVADRCAI